MNDDITENGNKLNLLILSQNQVIVQTRENAKQKNKILAK